MRKFFPYKLCLLLLLSSNLYSWEVLEFKHSETSTKIQIERDNIVLEYFVTREVTLENAVGNFHAYLSQLVRESRGEFLGTTDGPAGRRAVKYSIQIDNIQYIIITNIRSPFSNTVISYSLIYRVPAYLFEVPEELVEEALKLFNSLRNVPQEHIERLIRGL